MTESDFWSNLEHRLYREFAGLGDPTYRSFWCDGITPDFFHLDDPHPRITGRAWTSPTGQDPWAFTLHLPTHVRNTDQIDWAGLLPPENVTGWLCIDAPRRHLTIDPSATHPI